MPLRCTLARSGRGKSSRGTFLLLWPCVQSPAWWGQPDWASQGHQLPVCCSRCRGRGDPIPGVPLKGSSASSTTSPPVPQRWATSRLFSRSFLELTQQQCSGPLTDLQVPSRLYATPFGSKAWNRALTTTITTCPPSPPTCAGQSVTFYCVVLSRMATARGMSSHIL